MFTSGRSSSAYLVMMAGSLAAFFVAMTTAEPERPVEIFTGLLVHDSFALFMRRLLLLFVLLFNLVHTA